MNNQSISFLIEFIRYKDIALLLLDKSLEDRFDSYFLFITICLASTINKAQHEVIVNALLIFEEF